jgi:glycosyltransferase involved in cell wall biosynthesis
LSFREKLLWRMQQMTIERADMISVVSSDFANFASEIWKINKGKSRVILNAVDVLKFSPDPSLSKELSVLYVGRMTKNKGILTLADAIPDILRYCPEAKFIFAGKNMFLKEGGFMAQDYISTKAPVSQLCFLGEIDPNELASFYQKSSVAVFPSFYESSGIACLEAMSCGCTIVASEVGGIKDMISHEEQGLLVAPGSPQELAKAIVRLFQDKNLRESCARNAVQKVAQDFNYDKLVHNTLKVYEDTIANYRLSAGH